MKRILQLLFVSVIAFSCSEESIEATGPEFGSGEKTVTLILDDIPEGFEGAEVYVFTRNNDGEIYAIASGTATDGESILIVPTPGGENFSLAAYISTDEDWVANLSNTTNPSSPAYSTGYYSVSGTLSDKQGTYVTTTWDATEVSGPGSSSGSLGAVIEATLTDPLNDAQISQGSIVEISASVDDNINSGIATVAFLLDGSQIETVEAEPYSINWNTVGVSAGEHILSVVATNNSGSSSEDQIEVLITTSSNQAPSVTIGASHDGNAGEFGTISNNEQVDRQSLVYISASASADTESVEFRIGGTLVKTDTEAPYNYFWDTFDNSTGVTTIEVTAIDDQGEERSDFLNVSLVQPTSEVVRISINSPSNNSSFTVGDDIDFVTSITQNGCVIELYTSTDFDNSPYANFQGTFGNTDFTFNTGGLSAGDYTFTVVVYDVACNLYTIEDINITLN